MIGELFARQQVDRLRGLDCFVPAEFRDGVVAELVLVMRGCEDLTAALSVTNDWLHDQREWPKPSDLRRLVNEENAKRRPAAEVCPTCNGTRMVIVERGLYTGAKDCPACVRQVQPEAILA